MKSLSDLLLNHPIPGIRQSEERRTCALVLSQVLGIEVHPKHIQVKEGALTLALPPVVKAALRIKKGELIQKLSAEGVVVSDLR